MNDIKDLEKTLKLKFKNKNILLEAVTHRSYLNENKNLDRNHNERLEFLGDAVLELAVTQFLFDKYKDFAEGELTSFRSALVKTENLAKEAERLNLGQYVFMSKGEESTGGRTRPYILANTVESVIGAIYLDQSFDAANKFIVQNICYKIDDIVKDRLDVDAKSKLQEVSQEITKFTPTYHLVKAEGPDHDKVFEMAVYIGDHKFAQAKGKSKQDAEQKAAKIALENWDELHERFFNS